MEPRGGDAVWRCRAGLKWFTGHCLTWGPRASLTSGKATGAVGSSMEHRVGSAVWNLGTGFKDC